MTDKSPTIIHNAIKIRDWWIIVRNNSTFNIINNVLKNGIILNDAKEMVYNDLHNFLNKKIVINIYKQFIKRIYTLSKILHTTEQIIDIQNLNIKVILSAYLIICYKNKVFRNISTFENELYKSAIILIKNIEKLCNSYIISGCYYKINKKFTENINVHIFNYIDKWYKWKKYDEGLIVDKIKHALLHLYHSYQYLPSFQDDPLIVKEYEDQITRLRLQLKRISSESVLLEFEKQYIAKYISFNINDYRHNHDHIFSDFYDFYNDNNNNDNEDLEFNNLSNERLVHEMLINPNFKINICKNNICYIELMNDLKQVPQDFNKVLNILIKIKENIVSIIPNNETININDIETSINENKFSITKLKDILNDIFLIFNSEITHEWEMIMKKVTKCDVKEAFDFIFYIISRVKTTLINTRIHFLTPVLKYHGYEYESKQFKDNLNKGLITLTNTTIIINTIIDKNINENSIFKLLLINNNYKTCNIVYNNIVINTIINFNIDTCPETLLFDVLRLKKLHCEFKYIVTSSIILTYLFHYFSSNNKSYDKLKVIGNYLLKERNDIKYEQLLSNINDLIIQDSQIDIKNIILNCNDENNSIYKLFSKKLSVYYNQLLENEMSEYNYIISYKIFNSRIKESVNIIDKIVEINKIVHIENYNNLIHAKLKLI